ncbi:MAG: bifunctional hydroxymethylpyrimidine kinase/phosphomethylpyrimidine kinase [Acidobacteriota bacterium]
MKNQGKKFPAALTVGGFDPGSGAGVIADIKTLSTLGVYGTSVITLLTAQNHGEFFDIAEIDPSMFRAQLKAVFSGYEIKAVKTGLITPELAEDLVIFMKGHKNIPVVADTVFSSTSGKLFAEKENIKNIKSRFLPYTSLITPNLKEASLLSGIPVRTREDMFIAGRKLSGELKVPVLIKGGHLKPSGNSEGRVVDILFYEKEEELFESEFVKGVDTHGSGCILSSAITAFLARGFELKDSIGKAKYYMDGLLNNPADLEKTGIILDPLANFSRKREK